jgi:hypothetical protein
MPAFRTMIFGASLAIAAAIVPAAAANAAVNASVDIGNTATLLARGAGVSVPVTLTCTSDLPLASEGYGYVSVSITQRQGKNFAQGGNTIYVRSCDGTPQTYTLVITGNLPFKTGAILASSSFQVCDVEYTCSSGATSETIQIDR